MALPLEEPDLAVAALGQERIAEALGLGRRDHPILEALEQEHRAPEFARPPGGRTASYGARHSGRGPTSRSV